jgi:hypothetical protein
VNCRERVADCALIVAAPDHQKVGFPAHDFLMDSVRDPDIDHCVRGVQVQAVFQVSQPGVGRINQLFPVNVEIQIWRRGRHFEHVHQG